MPSLKDTLWGILFITLASALMMLAVAQLDSSAWAEGVRADFSAEITTAESEPVGELEGLPAPLMIVAPLLKITLLMGIPGLITLAVLRRKSRKGKSTPAGAAPS